MPLIINGINEVKVRGVDDDHRRGRLTITRQWRQPGGYPNIRPADQHLACGFAVTVAFLSYDRDARLRSRFTKEFVEDIDSGLNCRSRF